MLRLILALLISLGLLLCGCKVDTSPKTLMTHSAGSEPVLRKAPRRGTYTLYEVAKAADGSRQRQALISALLRKGERVGFTRDGQGRLIALAGGGEPEVLSASSDYLWEVRAQRGIDSGRTALLITGLVIVGAAIVLGAMLSAFSDGWNDVEWFSSGY